VHCNIGGGYDDQSQADLTFAWMIGQLSPLLDFNEDYLTYQLAATKKVNEQDGLGDIPWGLGTLYDSNQFPTSAGGKELRMPGRYHRLNYKSGKRTPTMLQGTNEKVHASVRARYAFGGVQSDLKKTPYSKNPVLDGWSLASRKDADGNEKWVWTYGPPGTDNECFEKEMEEAELSDLEKKILMADTATWSKLFPENSE
jgi:hypothetical protein